MQLCANCILFDSIRGIDWIMQMFDVNCISARLIECRWKEKSWGKNFLEPGAGQFFLALKLFSSIISLNFFGDFRSETFCLSLANLILTLWKMLPK